eukprot:scaffold413806_cov55-Attheya_sp.AAC.2
MISLESRGRAQVTEYKRLQTINSNYISSSQKRDGIRRDVSDFLLTFLYIEIPVSTNQAIFDITHSQIYRSLVKCCYKVHRSELFVYGAQNLKKYNHWTLGKVGGDHFETEQSSVNFISLTNDRDWDYDAGEPNQPICIFTRNKLLEGTPYLDLVKSHFNKLTSSKLMVELLHLLRTCDDRKTRMVSIGFTNLQADTWRRSAIGVCPGLLTVTHDISSGLKLWCGNFMILLSYHFRATLSQSGGEIPELYVITPERRKYLHYFAEVLGLPPS